MLTISKKMLTKFKKQSYKYSYYIILTLVTISPLPLKYRGQNSKKNYIHACI